MRYSTPACDERRADMRADTTLRTLVELDSPEPSRALDRAVLALAREAASGRAPRRGAGGRPLRWGFPAAVAAAAVCAVVVQRTASSPATPSAAAQFLVGRTQNGALEMVKISAHYRGAEPGVGAPAAPAHLARSDLGESHRTLIPSLIFASAPLLSISTAPLRRHGTEEQTPRAATRSSEQALRRDRQWTARRRMRPPGLYDSVDSSQPAFEYEGRPAPPPPPVLGNSVNSLGPSAPGRSAHVRAESSAGAPAGPH